MDITTAMVGAGSKALAGALTSSGKVGVARVGSREERKASYLEFAQACTQFILAVGWANAMMLSDPNNSLKQAATVFQGRTAAAHLMATTHVAVRMSGTPEVIAMANRLGDAARAVGEGSTGRGDEADKTLAEAFVNAMDSYLELCRYELWYQPRWWQPHRLVMRWWSDRPARKEAKSLAKRARTELKKARRDWELLSKTG